MEVILKEDIRSLGKAGEVVRVKEGYARNFLLPRGKAIQADTNNLKALEHHKKGVAAKQAKLKAAAEETAKKLATITVTLQRDAGEEDKLFGSVTNKDISEALKAQKMDIDKKTIHLEHPIKTLGETEVSVKLHPEVTQTLKVRVVKE